MRGEVEFFYFFFERFFEGAVTYYFCMEGEVGFFEMGEDFELAKESFFFNEATDADYFKWRGVVFVVLKFRDRK